MGSGIVNELKKEFQINDEWVSFEIHPETPPEGVAINSLFPEHVLKAMYQRLKVMGSEYGIEFNANPRLSNSRIAFEASEFAREKGNFHQFHEAVFYSYFTEGKDIGNLEVILDLAQGAGLNRDELHTALVNSIYLARLKETQIFAQKCGITGAPTFIINGEKQIIGAQPIQVFRDTLNEMANS